MSQKDSENLLLRIKNDDEVAFRSLFDQWYLSLYHHAISFVGDHQVAEDIVQELFIKLWVNRKKIAISVSVKNYLYRSVRNRCLNFIRDDSKRKLDRTDFAEELNIAEVESDQNEHEMLYKLHSLAQEAIRDLPERCRVIFNMSRNSELTNKEIAEKLGLSEKTIENQITIALKKLRERLGPILDKLLIVSLYFGWYFFWG